VFNKKVLAASVAVMVNVAASAGDFDPDSMRVGVFDFTPTVDVSESYNDNLYKQESGAKSSSITRIAPKFVLETQNGDDIYRINYGLESGLYSAGSDDNYLDQNISALALFQLGRSHKLDLNADYFIGHDDRGSGYTQESGAQLNIDEPDEWTRSDVGATYTFGAEQAKGNIEVAYNHGTKKYTNHHSVADGNADERDYKTNQLDTTFYLRQSPRSQVFLELSAMKYDYDKSDLDSDQDAALLGVKWQATASTTGIAKLGYLSKDYDASQYDDFSGSSWLAQIQWQPLAYSTFDFYTSRVPQESSGSSSYIDNQKYVVDWTHSWTPLLNTVVHVGKTKSSYKGTSAFEGIDRDDDIDTYGVGAFYSVVRQLTVGIDYQYEQRDSNQDGLSYDRNIVAVNVKLGL